MRKSRNLHYWAQCRKCRDMFTIYIKAYEDTENEDWWIGRVEKSRELFIDTDGAPFHRCGGELRIMGNDIKLRFSQ